MNRRLIPYIVVTLALVGLWYAFVLTPHTKQKTSSAARRTQAMLQLADIDRTLKELPRFVRTRRQLESQKHDLNARLYAKDDILTLFERLVADAQTRNLSIAEVTPPIEELLSLNRLVPDSDQPPFLSISVRLTGSYTDFCQYVSFVEESGFFRGINQCHISSTPNQSGQVSTVLGFRALLGGVPEESS